MDMGPPAQAGSAATLRLLPSLLSQFVAGMKASALDQGPLTTERVGSCVESVFIWSQVCLLALRENRRELPGTRSLVSRHSLPPRPAPSGAPGTRIPIPVHFVLGFAHQNQVSRVCRRRPAPLLAGCFGRLPVTLNSSALPLSYPCSSKC